MQTSSRLEQIYAKLRDLVASGVTSAEETLGQVLEVLSGTEKTAEKKAKDAKSGAEDAYDEKKAKAQKSAESIRSEASQKKTEL